MGPKNQLKILFIEDLPSDVDLAVLELRKEKLIFEYTTVCSRVDLINALKEFKPEVIISDYMMPSFNGLQALKESKRICPDVPFILCTGSVNEETAVECIKEGAQDYVIKEHITRLPFAVKEALEQVIINNEKRASELLLKENEEKLQSIFSAAPVGIGLVVNRVLIEVNDFFCNMTGYSRKELIGKSSEIVYSSTDEFIAAGGKKYQQISEKGTGSVETKLKCKDGRILNVILSSTPLDKKDHSKGVTFTVLDITERKKSEEALQESQRLFQTLAMVSPVGIFRTQPDGFTTYVNPRWMELSGLTFEEAIGLGWLKAVHPDDREQLEGKWKTDFQLHQSSIAEYRFLKPDGSVVWVMGNASPEWNYNKITGYIGTITDITEHKKTEEAIAESEMKYRHLVTQSLDGIFIIDLTGKFISVNKAICDNLKYPEAELLSMNLSDIVPEKFHSLYKQRLLAIVKGENSTGNAEYEVKGKDGIFHSIEVMSSPSYKGSEIVGFQGIARDITERNRAEKALRESEEKYRGIFENVQDVYYETSIDGAILEVSPSIRTLSKGQYSINELVGKSMIDFYSELGDRQVILDGLRSKGTITDFEVSFKNKDGSVVPCSISAKLIMDSKGQPKKIIGSMHDITDRKNVTEALKIAKDKAEASDKLKTSFLNNISHEVRTPLNGILGFAEIISQPDLSDEDKKESLLMLSESSDRLLSTITNYMDISLLASGSLSVHRRDFSPAKILKTIYNNFDTICAARNLGFLLNISEEAVNLTINSDPEIFHKIISHLLNNAVKFTEQGSIEFGYHIDENYIVFFVKDTGIGIGKESIEIVFDTFSKEERGHLKISEGSGLGLSIAKGMIEIIGGRIRAESILGEGSCFYVYLPVEPKPSLIQPDVPQKDEKTIKLGDLILVAEDDDTNFFYLNALITRETSAKVLRAANGMEAIELYKANPGINLILMDMKMPEIDGFEATRQIKRLNQLVPVIAITAYAMSGDEDRIIAAGCDGYISKPINKKSLIEKMSEFIKILPPIQT
jgi:PAS domain S-box-containing protein